MRSRWIVCCVWLLCAGFTGSVSIAEIVLYPPPGGLPASSQYTVQVNDNGMWVDSFVNFDIARTEGAGSGDEAGKTFSWTTFETDGPVAVRVRRLDGGFGNVTIRPLRHGISASTVSADTVEFTLQPGQKVSVEFDTEIKAKCYDGTNGIPCVKDILMIFADPLKTTSAIDGIPAGDIYSVPTGSHEQIISVPGTDPAGKSTLGDCNGKPVVVFGPGVYDIGYWQVPNSIEQIHFEGGAVVFGAVDVIPQGLSPFYDAATINQVYRDNWRNQTLRSSFKVTGPGILSSAKLPWHLKKDFTYTSGDDWWAHVKILQLAVQNITVEDVTLANSPHWVLTLINDYDNRSTGVMDNFKLVGAWTYNNDGTPNLGPGGIIRNAFIHADDDAFKIYNSSSTIENCVVWQANNGAVFQYGWFPKTNSNVSVTDIDVIHFENWYGGSSNRAVFNYANASGNGTISNMNFMNINIEGRILRLFGFNCGNQEIRDFFFTNLYCDGMGVGNPAGNGNNYFSGDIHDFHFNNFFFDGAPVTANEDALFEFSNGADGTSFTYQDSLTLYYLAHPQNTVVMEGSDAQFSVSVYSESPETYQWYKKDGGSDVALTNGSKYSGATSATLTIHNCQNADETSYFCVADNADSDPAVSNLASLIVTSPSDLAQGLIGYWPGEGDMQDLSGSNHHGTKSGSGTLGYSSGKIGQSFVFDNNVAIDTGVWDPTSTGQMSIAFWCNINVDQYDGIIAKNGTAGKSFALEVKSGSQQLEFSGQDWLQQNGSITLNDWYHVIITVDVSSTTAQMYINGMLNKTHNSFDLGSGSGSPVIIGAKAPTTQFMGGQLDEVAIWDRALTDLDIEALWNDGSGTSIFMDNTKAHSPVPGSGDSGIAFDTGVRLKWRPAASAEVTGYTVYFGDEELSMTQRGTVNTEDPDGYYHYDIAAGEFTYSEDYFWRIDSVTAGDPVTGDLWSFTTESIPVNPPAAVQNFQATGAHEQVNLNWAVPLEDGNAPIQNYRIYRGPDAGNLAQIDQVPSGMLEYTDDTVVNNTAYVYAVSADNGSYEGPTAQDSVQAAWHPLDFNEDGIIDLEDFGIFSQQWLWQAPWHQPQ